MTKLLTLLSIVVLTNSCSTTKTVSFTTHNNKGQAFSYSLKLPKGYTLRRLSFENENFDSYTYPDSSKIFFSDNLAQSAFPKDAYLKYGKDVNLLFLSSETITLSGHDEVAKYWKTCKLGNVVYGYVQVPADKQNQFDSILNSFKKIER
jgi:hypothetical protein